MAHKFRLHDDGDVFTGQAGFLDWITEKKPRRRAGKPLLTAKTWKVAADPWRRIHPFDIKQQCKADPSLTEVTRCAVGLDVMKCYPCNDLTKEREKETRVTGLMGYDENGKYI